MLRDAYSGRSKRRYAREVARPSAVSYCFRSGVNVVFVDCGVSKLGFALQIRVVSSADRVYAPHTCLHCMGAIPEAALTAEQLSDGERRAQRYVDDLDAEGDDQLDDPSVITLNAIAASLAATEFLFMFTGRLAPVPLVSRVYYPQTHEVARAR